MLLIALFISFGEQSIPLKSGQAPNLIEIFDGAEKQMEIELKYEKAELYRIRWNSRI
jgi:hypothetical protein